MELIEDIDAFFKTNNIRSKLDLINLIDSDNYVFKRLIKTLVYQKLRRMLGNELALSGPIELAFPRSNRKLRFDQIKDATKLTFPGLELSSNRRIVLIASFLFPAMALIFLILNKSEFFIIPYTDFGLFLYLFLCSLPSVLITVVDQTFFQPLDLPNIGDMNDLLDGLVARNWQAYREDNFQRTISELEEMPSSFPIT